MRSFENYLVDCRSPVWDASAYMDYAAIKEVLKTFIERRQQLSGVGRSDVEHPPNDCYFSYDDAKNFGSSSEEELILLSIHERDAFSDILQKELSQAANFYKHTILPDLNFLVDGRDGEAARHALIEAAIFFVTTVITFRQAMIRYDAFRRTFDGTPLTEWHYQMEQNESVHSVFQWDELVRLQNRLLERDPDENELVATMGKLQNLLSLTEDSVQRSVSGHIVFRDKFLSSIRNYFLFGLQSYGLAMEPQILVLRGRHLKQELRAVAHIRQMEQAASNDSNELPMRNRFPLVLNLLSCFLYMMNNYIIEPSSAYYANALGTSDALSGIMIGGAAWFALISSVMYSFWTNHSYKNPILFSAVLQMVGNLLYATAFSFGSMSLCLLGRALTGLGAPRVINRRYVADATPFQYRTIASAAFCLATAIGSALGPGFAIILDAIPDWDVEFLGIRHYWNGMTAPGYFMAAMWLLYAITVLFTFHEPLRSGLAELKRREKAQALIHEVESDDEDADSVGSGTNDRVYRNEAVFSFWPGLTRAVLLTMSLIFMKRVALESIVGSTSVITKNRYGWSIQNVGTLHLVNGILVIPVSAFAGWLSTRYEDRVLATAFLVLTLAGMLPLIDITDFQGAEAQGYNEDQILSVGPIKYIAGSLIAFSGIEACEAYVASLMSKVVPSSLATGTFNSGLFATLVGTGGRASGDLFITLMGLISIRHLLNLLIIPGSVLVAISIALIQANYEILGV